MDPVQPGTSQRNVNPRLEDDPASAGRLPRRLRRELAELSRGELSHSLTQAYVLDGPSPVGSFLKGNLPDPDDEDACNDVARFCLDFGLVEHFAFLPPATKLTVWTGVAIETIECCLEAAPALRKLTLASRYISQDNAGRIAALVTGMPALEELEFRACELAPGAARELFSLPLNPRLKSLTLQGVDLAGTMETVAPALGRSSLESIRLSGASLGNDDVARLCQELASNRSMVRMDLTDNLFDDGSALLGLVRERRSPIGLELQGVPLDVKQVAAIECQMAENHLREAAGAANLLSAGSALCAELGLRRPVPGVGRGLDSMNLGIELVRLLRVDDDEGLRCLCAHNRSAVLAPGHLFEVLELCSRHSQLATLVKTFELARMWVRSQAELLDDLRKFAVETQDDVLLVLLGT